MMGRLLFPSERLPRCSLIVLDRNMEIIGLNQPAQQLMPTEKLAEALMDTLRKRGESFPVHRTWSTVMKGVPYSAEVFPLGPRSASVVCLQPLEHESGAAGVKLQGGWLDGVTMQDLIDLFMQSHDGLVLTDATGIIRLINPGYERLSGVTASELIGRNVLDLEQQGFVSRTVTPLVVRTRQGASITQKVKSGKDLLATGSPIFDEKMEIRGIVVNVRDLNELNYHQQLGQVPDEEDKDWKEAKARHLAFEEIVSQSKPMEGLLDAAVRVARFDANVLITGESGVGKEPLARVLHISSPRAKHPFIRINCSAIPEHLLESELFGYEPGAFTGALKDGKHGLLEVAGEGTVLLDEVGDLPLTVQPKLLRAIQEREITRVGGTKPRKVKFRLVCATNIDLVKMVSEKRFREDLYYRINVVHLHIPPLRERKSDILPLAIHFLDRCNRKCCLNRKLSKKFMDALESYHWPGNVRELENTIERLVVMSTGDLIDLDDLPSNILGGVRTNPFSDMPFMHLEQARDYVERKLITTALANSPSLRQAAGTLGVTHSTLLRKMRQYEITSNRSAGSEFNQNGT